MLRHYDMRVNVLTDLSLPNKLSRLIKATDFGQNYRKNKVRISGTGIVYQYHRRRLTSEDVKDEDLLNRKI